VRETPARRGVRVLPLVPRERAPRARWRVVAGAIAASLLVVAGGTAAWRARSGAERAGGAEPPPREFSTARGQRATIHLVDGTRVELGFASTLRVRPFAAGGRRELSLEGEAVFDVAHDPRRPFLVHAANAVTEDLGTTFGVRAYPADSVVRVVVVSGRVALRERNPAPGAPAPAARGAVLGPGELGRLDAAGRLEVERHVDTSEYVGWLAGRVSFRDARLDEVAAELERRYDVTIRIPDSTVAARRVTVDMTARSLTDVLDAATIPLDLRYRRVGGAIVLER
jgi:transmembrane sensor